MQAAPHREWTEQDDALLDAILALRARWEEHRGALTLEQCALDPHLTTVVVSGLCSRHGQFVAEWTGRAGDRAPLDARCPAALPMRCTERCPVFVLV
ncbi:MAG TPA: hypothetical protein VI814_01835 [Candidatus Limnocylindria bacterium]